ncbi:hypothetical protein [Carbonactinospora thermoautotrophica]|uniref:hypothetical protein n=1 Tax=Carbonactinospora thermoautotrophica TaxID=1469144 RepID=UPI000AE78585|nr:hypothetical protein [Carbonactinospora thermoautotrophica]
MAAVFFLHSSPQREGSLDGLLNGQMRQCGEEHRMEPALVPVKMPGRCSFPDSGNNTDSTAS